MIIVNIKIKKIVCVVSAAKELFRHIHCIDINHVYEAEDLL